MIDPSEKIKIVGLSECSPGWPTMLTNVSSEIKSILRENCLEVHHMGSTEIPNIYTKQIVDVVPCSQRY